MSLFTTFGSFSIAAGILLIFLIFVMLAAERRGELGIARAVGTRRGHLVQMFLYEGLAYDLARRGRRRAARRRRRLRDGARAWRPRSTRPPTSRSRFSVRPTSIVDRLRDRRAADARRRRVLGLARQPDEHRHARSATCPSRRPQRTRRARWLLGARRARARRAARRRRRQRRRTAIALGFGVSLVVLGLVPIAARARRARAARLHGGRARARRVVRRCRSSRWLLGDLKIELLDLHPRRPRDRRRRELGDHVQRRRPARRG